MQIDLYVRRGETRGRGATVERSKNCSRLQLYLGGYVRGTRRARAYTARRTSRPCARRAAGVVGVEEGGGRSSSQSSSCCEHIVRAKSAERFIAIW